MKKKFTFLMAALMLLTMMVLPGNAVGQSKTNFVINTTNFTSINSGSGYAAYDGDHTISNFTINSKDVMIGSSKLQFKKSSGALYNKTAMPGKITKITLATTENLVIYVGTDENPSTTTVTSGSTISGDYLYFKVKNSSSKNAAYTATITVEYASSYSVTYTPGTGASGTNVVDSNISSGTSITVRANNGQNGNPNFSKDGFVFNGWNDGTNNVAAGASYTVTNNVTFTAQWQSAASPSIVINGGTALALAKTAAEAQTITVAYNNMSEYSNPSIALFNDSGCTSSFTAGWFTASLSGDGSTTLNYSISANTVGERTVYIRISATYNEETITSVLAATQATSTRTVTYQANGGTGSDVVKTYDYGTNVTILAYNNEAIGFTPPTDKAFKNWKENSTTYDAGATISSISANHTLVAQWEDLPTYSLVTSNSDLIGGKHYIIVGLHDDDNNYTYYAMTNQSTNNRRAEDVTEGVTVSSNTITLGVGSTVHEVVISGPDDDGYYTIYDEASGDSNGYIYDASTSGNNSKSYLKTKSNLDDAGDAGKWNLVMVMKRK